jgi:hypothetical protein
VEHRALTGGREAARLRWPLNPGVQLAQRMGSTV